MGHAGAALVPSSPPPALLISSTGGNKSQQGVLLAWRQHVDTKKMQECPGDLSTQLEGQMGPLSSSKTQRAQLQHPQATILVGGMQFLGGGVMGILILPHSLSSSKGTASPGPPVRSRWLLDNAQEGDMLPLETIRISFASTSGV